MGAYCIERELLTWRRLRFPQGVEIGDIVVFPSTASYLMHILESASHEIPLARKRPPVADRFRVRDQALAMRCGFLGRTRYASLPSLG